MTTTTTTTATSKITSSTRRRCLDRSQQQAFTAMKSLSSIQLLIAVALLFDSTTAFTAQRGTGTAFHDGSRMARSFASPLSATDDSMSSSSSSKTDTVAPMMSTSSSRWWNPLSAKSSSSSNGNSGSSVDDYLEFLERRYSRLYDHEQKQESRAKFSVMSWLQQGEASEPTSSSSNAMYALGVAGIAGKQLLEKHSDSVVSKQAPFQDAQIMDKTLSTQLSSETALFSSVIATKLGPIFRKISHKRQILIRYESQKLHAAIVFLLKTALRLPVKLGQAIWNMGGGKKTIALTFTVATALTLVLMRPIVEAVSTSIRQA